MNRMTRMMALAVLVIGNGAFSAETPGGQESEAPPAQGAVEPSLADVIRELSDLKEEVLRLEQRLDLFLNSTVADLTAENERLRKEVRDLYTTRGAAVPSVPMPDRALLEGLAEPKPTPEENATAAPEEQASASDVTAETEEPKALAYDVVAEWGRTPEQAAETEPEVSSLKGMICVVPAGSREGDLIALARSLRVQFADFDNINIEVFDDPKAAQTYKESSVAQPGHRVLSVSRHAASGRDVIILLTGEKPREIPIAETPPEL